MIHKIKDYFKMHSIISINNDPLITGTYMVVFNSSHKIINITIIFAKNSLHCYYKLRNKRENKMEANTNTTGAFPSQHSVCH